MNGHPTLQALIETAFEARAEINPRNITRELRTALDECLDLLDSGAARVAGANMSAGSWWSNFHAVTYHEDHGRWAGKDEPVKFDGVGADRKQAALKIALEMAA